MRIFQRSFIVCVGLLLGMVTGTTAQDMNNPDVIEYQLDNGLQVMLVPDTSAPTVAVSVWYRVGGANDPQGRSGFAHLFEHMMFQGSANVARSDHFNLISAAGGSANATTGRDRTNYFQSVPSHQLPLALWLEADRMATLMVDEANFIREREVVKEEYRQRIDNQPYGQASLALQTIPFDYTPYQQPIIGSIEDLDQATVEEIRAFHDTYYVPNNATLVVAGDFDIDTARAMIDDYFGGIARGADVPELPAYTPTPQTEAERVTFEDSLARVPAVLIAYEIVPRNHPDFLALELLGMILGGGESSRLAQALIDTGLASSASAYATGNLGPGQFNAVLVPNPEVSLETLEETYYAELERILSEGVEAAELEKVINQLRVERVLSLQTALGLAESIQSSYFYLGSPTAAFDELTRFTGLTSADVQRVIETYLAPENRTIIEVVPVERAPTTADAAAPAQPVADSEVIALDDTAEREAPPPPLTIREFTLPEIHESELDNGLRVVIIPQNDLPILGVQLILPGGGSIVPERLAGMAGITAGLLTRGTTTRTAQEIAGQIEQIGGELDASASSDALTISSLVLSEHTSVAFDLLSDVALNPVFPPEELEIQRQRALTNLQSTLADPADVATRVFSAVVYGEHPYGNLITEDAYNAITRDDVAAYYRGLLDPTRATLIIAGDISLEAALEQAETAFGSWQGTGEAAERVAFPEMPTHERAIYLVDRPGSTQVELLVGHPGVIGSAPERRVLQVVNNILGGGAASRLFQNLREQRGYTYGVYSGFNFPVDRGLFTVTAAVRPDVLTPALEEIIAEIERIQSEPVSTDELENNKSNLLGRYARSLETVLGLAGQVASFEVRGVPLSELEIYPETVAQVDASAVLSAAQTYLYPDSLVIVAVGDAAVIRPALEAVAPVILVDANGEPTAE